MTFLAFELGESTSWRLSLSSVREKLFDNFCLGSIKGMGDEVNMEYSRF